MIYLNQFQKRSNMNLSKAINFYVIFHLLLVTLLTAIALLLKEWISERCKAYALLHLLQSILD
ncbi:hypothetical protein [Orientia tsutsugamushi]|uniref:hypothetical protein n=1 Tax=Orientia tsutsugamushi TaxID=784 RepID=UPI000A56EE02|nr:hypothetical protein [Orientia tsutsugamushi]